ncbi:MAG: CRISPR-associated endonuclease Cas2 [Sulfurovum sp.]|nr:CRISPR-associated endonuclease Cas2 [Sulfurovum sp.]MCB4755246.1 CRISPR-associated endonuclease Cas2 [Sulfurovum sp.]MCB4762191.1 CRISPR-associated endonuclease Cas2 [Sulfurovum sp.]MCB4763549.1 CRISPR-associated endonuclease Cas2 [Sulfurovum sp.]MCB4773290.1 CRISPR-associated endonuclease Cas2 [Sulfurovum sp.]
MSAFRIMWLVVMFDLPTQTKKDRKCYRWFSKHLDAEGYIRLQYSIYAKVFNSVGSANNGKKRLKNFLKTNVKKGNVRMLMFTDAQFGKMEIIVGEISTQEEITQPSLFDF